MDNPCWKYGIQRERTLSSIFQAFKKKMFQAFQKKMYKIYTDIENVVRATIGEQLG